MKRTNLDSWIEEIEGIGSLSREKLEALQLERLGELLKKEKERNGFYGKLPYALSSLDELPSLPFTTADDITEQGSAMLLVSQSEVQSIISDRTSGTSGAFKRIFFSEEDLNKTVGLFRAGISEMSEAGEKILVAMPFSGPFGLGNLIAKAVESFGAVPIAPGNAVSFYDFSELVKRERPDAIIGSPVFTLSLLRILGGESPIKKALISADACPESVQNDLEKRLCGRVFPHYGSRECGLGGAISCMAHEGMHLRENHIIAEIIDSEGNVLPRGERGELVISTIGHSAMPLIRYKTGDITKIFAEPCLCGGVSLRLGNVIRNDPAAKLIYALDNALFSVPNLIDYSLQKSAQGYLIRATATADCGDELRARAREILGNSNFDVELSFLNRESAPSYKAKRTLI
ncbi:MAG: DVU_1553 family AMP-dependent CoA ligase [Candidatus Scatomorpha sp.]|jgi:phenylacetate-CoA ligase